jgi:hypothetical protein
MAVRRPITIDGSGNIIEMTDAQINQIKDRARYLYGSNPSVTLSHVASGGTLSPGMADTRLSAGATSTDVSAFPNEATTAEPTINTVTTYDRVSQTTTNTTESPDTNNKAFPCYLNGTNIQAMTRDDFYDTFVYDAIDTIAGAVGQPGTYRIHTSNTLTGYTNLGLIFSDTRANPDNYVAEDIPAGGEVYPDQASLIQDFYLLSKDNIAAPSFTSLVFIRSDNNLQQYSTSSLDTILQNSIRHVASEVVGSRIRYKLDTTNTGTLLGTAITDTRLNGDGAHTTHEATADDYRAAEFPDGTAETISTWYLRVVQE